MSERAPSLGPGIKDLLLGVAPVIVIIISTLGVILAGITTPTDAGAVCCFATDAHRHSGADLRVRLAAEPIVQAAGIDLIWFCTLVGVTLKTASSPSRS